MPKEIRQDLYTQAEWAKKIKKSRAYVNQQVKEGKIHTVTINGAILVKA